MRIGWALAMLLALGACQRHEIGPAPAPPIPAEPWRPAAGLWVQGFTSGPQAGFRTVVCVGGGRGDVFGDERPPVTDGQMVCEAVRRQRTPTGWTADQRCSLRGHVGLYQYIAQVVGADDVAARVAIIDPANNQPLSTPADVRFRRAGVCPAGFAPGEVMQINQPGPDGQWQVIQPGQNGAPPTVRALADLPPEIAALRAPAGPPSPPLQVPR